MKNKEEGANPEIISIGLNISCSKFRDRCKNGRPKKVHGHGKHNTNNKIGQLEEIQEAHSCCITLLLPQPHRFGYQHGCINTIYEPGEKDHGCKNKKVDICFNITAKVSGNNNG